MVQPDLRNTTVFTTDRLSVELATVEHVDLYFDLWTDPRVMSNVGFPKGIPISKDKIREQLERQPTSELKGLLVVVLKATGEAIGECKMHAPDEQGIARTDIKLLPELWGHKYGVEVKRGLLAHLFTHTDCVAVEATPNVENIASIKMQEAVGGVRTGESIDEFPDSMKDYTRPVHHYTYVVHRSVWQNKKPA